MSDKITWWPAALADNMFTPTIVLMRYDWPDERIYQFGLYVPGHLPSAWTDGHSGILSKPDYFVAATFVEEFIRIPEDREYTYLLGKETKE